MPVIRTTTSTEVCPCCGIPVVCCPDEPVPSRLYAAFSSDCALLNGLVIPLDKNPETDCWQGYLDISCSCSRVLATLCCVSGSWTFQWDLNAVAPSESCEIGLRIGGAASFTFISCVPFLATLHDTRIANIGIESCCVNMMYVDVTITD